MLFFFCNAEGEGKRERDRRSHHGADDKTVEVTGCFRFCKLPGERRAAHIVCKERACDNGRFKWRVFGNKSEHGGEKLCDKRRENYHSNHGKRHRAEKHYSALEFFAYADVVACYVIQCSQHGENEHYY